MEFGLHLPHVGPLATREGITAFAQLVEKLGFDALWVSDHIVVPRSVDSRYPYSRDGSFPVSPDVSLMEPIATLLFAAAVTERVKLGTTVLVLPMRNPIVTAKQLASLDVLSNGRLILGVGTGWMEEEFQMLNVPFKRRGARTNEYIRLLKALWTEENPSFEGEFWQIKNVGFNPKPLQKPHPPIWTGGHSAPALRRAGRLSDGWHAVGVSPDTLREQFKEVQRHAEEAGRDPASLTLSVRPRVRMDDPAKTIELLRSYREVGVSHVVLEIFAPDMDRVRSLMDTLANEIRPQVLA